MFSFWLFRNRSMKTLLQRVVLVLAFNFLALVVFLSLNPGSRRRYEPLFLEVISREPQTRSTKTALHVGKERTRHLRVLSQNLWLTQTATTGGSQAQRLQAFLDCVAQGGYDVVIVQELPIFVFGPLFISARVYQASEALTKAGFIYRTSLIHGIPYGGYFGQNSGVAIFSRYPIVNQLHSTFKAWTWREIPNNKGFVAVDIAVDDCTVRLASLHADAGPSVPTRSAQTKQVIEAVREMEPLRPFVIVGDFNVCNELPADCAEYEHFLDLVKSMNANEVFPGRRATWKEWPVDHIVMPSGETSLEIVNASLRTIQAQNGLEASDHKGIDFGLSFIC